MSGMASTASPNSDGTWDRYTPPTEGPFEEVVEECSLMSMYRFRDGQTAIHTGWEYASGAESDAEMLELFEMVERFRIRTFDQFGHLMRDRVDERMTALKEDGSASGREES